MDVASLSVESATRILVAVALGAAIGLQREVDDQPAGLRTHMSVSLGAALFGVISTLGFDEFAQERASSNYQIDVTRVASQVVVGIGFLGAGMIFRRGSDIRNLTTAASLWVTAAVGLAAGVGDPGIAAVTALVLLLSLGLFKVPRDWVRQRFTRKSRLVRIGMEAGAETSDLRAVLDDLDRVSATVVGAEKHDGRIELLVRLEGEPGVDPERCVGPLVDRADVALVRLEDESHGESGSR